MSSVVDGSGNRLVVLAGTAATALPVNARITATFPSATTYRMTADELAGVSRVDRTASALGPAGTFSSGPTGTTSAANEFVFGSVAVPSGSANADVVDAVEGHGVLRGRGPLPRAGLPGLQQPGVVRRRGHGQRRLARLGGDLRALTGT